MSPFGLAYDLPGETHARSLPIAQQVSQSFNYIFYRLHTFCKNLIQTRNERKTLL